MSNLHPVIERSLKHWMPNAWTGLKRTLPAQPSANISLRGHDWQVTYDYQPAEKPNYNVDSPLCGPGCDASVEICEIYLLNAPERNDFYPVLAESFIKELEAKVLESLEES